MSRGASCPERTSNPRASRPEIPPAQISLLFRAFCPERFSCPERASCQRASFPGASCPGASCLDGPPVQIDLLSRRASCKERVSCPERASCPGGLLSRGASCPEKPQVQRGPPVQKGSPVQRGPPAQGPPVQRYLLAEGFLFRKDLMSRGASCPEGPPPS